MEYKCPKCSTEMNAYNDIKSDMIDNPFFGRIFFECPNCRHYRRYSFSIDNIYKARDKIDAGIPVLACTNFDDYLRKLEIIAWRRAERFERRL